MIQIEVIAIAKTLKFELKDRLLKERKIPNCWVRDVSLDTHFFISNLDFLLRARVAKHFSKSGAKVAYKVA